jgi:hypothetical protein
VNCIDDTVATISLQNCLPLHILSQSQDTKIVFTRQRFDASLQLDEVRSMRSTSRLSAAAFMPSPELNPVVVTLGLQFRDSSRPFHALSLPGQGLLSARPYLPGWLDSAWWIGQDEDWRVGIVWICLALAWGCPASSCHQPLSLIPYTQLP